MQTLSNLLPGFESPALQSQQAYRILLDAWARPGRVVTFSGLKNAPEGWNTAASMIALTLCDFDTPVWLSGTHAVSTDWLKFHCGCRLVDDESLKDAAFVFAEAETLNDLKAFNRGTALSPEHGATLVISVEDQSSVRNSMKLTGPGIETQQIVEGFSLPERIYEERAGMRRLYPAGLDFILTKADQAVCIPRTVSIEQGS